MSELSEHASDASGVEPHDGERLEQELDPDALMTIREVAMKLRCHPRSIHRWLLQCKFPIPLRIGNGALRWERDDISQYIKEKKAESHAEGTRPRPRQHRASG